MTAAKANRNRQAPDACPANVRIATRADASWLEMMVLKGVAQEMAYAPINDQKIRDLVSEVTKPASANSLRSVVAIATGPAGEPVGAAPILPTQWWYSHEYHYVQPWIYILPEYRKRPYARTLVETAVWWSKKAVLPMVMVAPATAEMQQRREVYARYTRPFGGSFLHVGGMSRPTPKPESVSVADESHYDEVRKLCMELNEDNASASLAPEKLDELLHAVLREKKGIIAITKENGKIVGTMCLFLMPWDYSNAWHYAEWWVYVTPDARAKGHALNLLNFSKWFSEQTGVPVSVGVTSLNRVPAKLRLYSRLFKPLEAFYLHEARESK